MGACMRCMSLTTFFFEKSTAESYDVRVLKIGQHLAKLRARDDDIFVTDPEQLMAHPVYNRSHDAIAVYRFGLVSITFRAKYCNKP